MGPEARVSKLDDLRVLEVKPLIPPQLLAEEIPASESACSTVMKARKEAEAVISGTDDRLLVIVGPCSVHDPKAALEYGKLLKEQMENFKEELVIIMRVYFEKPRTTVGWKGLINDPFLDESFEINKGLRIGRSLLQNLNESGVPTACEFLDTTSPQYISDLVAWGAIGARTTESQVHRELASGMSCPIGFKNGTDGGIQIAVDAVQAASAPHHFLGVTKQGLSAIIKTSGNPACHIILRGGNSGPNYDKDNVSAVIKKALAAKGVNPRLMIDCSHGNSNKDHRNQPKVAANIAEQVRSGNKNIIGVMIESNLKEGKQSIPAEGSNCLEYGKSITDACISFEDTIPVLRILAEAVKIRRGV